MEKIFMSKCSTRPFKQRFASSSVKYKKLNKNENMNIYKISKEQKWNVTLAS